MMIRSSNRIQNVICIYLVEVLDLVSPCKPELRKAMNEEYERFAGVPRFYVVYLDPVHPHELVLAVLGVQEAGGGRGTGLHPEQGAP